MVHDVQNIPGNGNETQNQLITATQQPSSPVALSADVEMLLERFLVEAELAETTKETYRRTLRGFFAWKEEREIADLDRSHILAYKQDMLARVRPSTASTYLTAVKSLFKWLESVRAYPNVAADIKTVKLVGNIHRKDALTPAQAKRVLQVLKGDTLQAKRDFALVNLLIRVGLRSVEVTRGRLGDLRNRGDQTILLVQGKGRVEKDALVVLTDATLGPIYDYLAARRCEGREVVGGGGLAAVRQPLQQNIWEAAVHAQHTADCEGGPARGGARQREAHDPQLPAQRGDVRVAGGAPACSRPRRSQGTRT